MRAKRKIASRSTRVHRGDPVRAGAGRRIYGCNPIAKYHGCTACSASRLAISWGYDGESNLGQGLFFGLVATCCDSLKLASNHQPATSDPKTGPQDFLLWNEEAGRSRPSSDDHQARSLWSCRFQSTMVRSRDGGIADAGRWCALGLGLIIFRKRIRRRVV